MKRYTPSILGLATILLLIGTLPGEEKPSKPVKLRPFTRLFIQDLKTANLVWTNVWIDENGQFSLGEIEKINGFKSLDPTKQKLVQMKEINRLICVGVRDEENGELESGWVLIDSGVGYVDHGDHGHWTYKNLPSIRDQRLDKKQGNPAHLYVYGNHFFLANDRLNGYTRIDPSKYENATKDTPRFCLGGGNHITLAVVEDRVGYSCWVDGGGPNKGRVDVTPIGNSVKNEPVYSFNLPSGGIHGAITNSGKVFFAPSEGICWVAADTELKLKPEEVKIHRIDLGKEGDKPLRTGAFINFKTNVVFVTGKDSSAALVVLNAKADEPKPIKLPISVKPGNQPTTPEVVITREGKGYALVFHDHAKDVDAEDRLDIFELDPNGDGDCADLKLVKSLKVGKSCVEGHFGHHDISFDADRRFGFLTNPGDGTLSILSLKTWEIVSTLKLGGTPTAVLACGTQDLDD